MEVASTTGESSSSLLSRYSSLVALIESAIKTAKNDGALDTAFLECCGVVVSIEDVSLAVSTPSPSMSPITALSLSRETDCSDHSMCANPGFQIQDGNFEFGDILYGDEGNAKEIIRSCVATQKNAQSFRSLLFFSPTDISVLNFPCIAGQR